MNLSVLLLLLAPLLPLLLALITLWPASQRWRPWLATLAPLPALLLSLQGDIELFMPWLLLGAHWQVTSPLAPFLTFTALLWSLAALYGQGYLRQERRSQRFWVLWLLTLTGNIGLLISIDLVSFYTFFALMTFAAYGLVVHNRSGDAMRAGRIYLIMALMGEMLILAGLFQLSAAADFTSLRLDELALVLATAAQQNLIFFCLFAGFGVKAGIALLHLWLPLAHPVAPTPASAVLSGAMIKAGLVAWLQLLPFGLVTLELWGWLLFSWGMLAAFGAGAVGIMQHSAKAVLAYSSISQMGLITSALGCALLAPEIWPLLLPVVVFYALHHGLAKGALFLSVSFNQHGRGIPPLLLGLGLLLPPLSLTGVLGSGAQGKLLLKALLYETTLPTEIITLITLSALATSLLMLRFLWLLWHQRSRHPDAAPVTMQLGWGLLVLCSALAVPLFAGHLSIQPLHTQPLAYLGLLWVPLGGLLLATLAYRYGRTLPIPAGDLIALLRLPSTLGDNDSGSDARLQRRKRRHPLSRRGRWYEAVELDARRQSGLLFSLLLILAAVLLLI